MSLRWLRALLDHGIVVRGQIVLCPGVNDGDVFERTHGRRARRVPRAASPWPWCRSGLSQFNPESAMRAAHRRRGPRRWWTRSTDWQEVFLRVLGRRMVFAADEYYLMAGLPFPAAEAYEGFPHARGRHRHGAHVRDGVHRRWPSCHRSAERASSPGSTALPPRATGRRGTPPATPVCAAAPTTRRYGPRRVTPRCPRAMRPSAILTGEFGAQVIGPLVRRRSVRPDVRVIARTQRVLRRQHLRHRADGRRRPRRACWPREPAGHRYLLPDVCLSEGRFLDGTTVADLPRPVEVVPTDGIALRRRSGPPA